MDYDLVCETLSKHYITKIVSGGARGADTLGIHYAIDNNIIYEEFLPNYSKYGKKAPFVRNKLIVNNSEIIVAFWDGNSRGTRHSLDYAINRGIKSIIINY